jgi:hypothetical protein
MGNVFKKNGACYAQRISWNQLKAAAPKVSLRINTSLVVSDPMASPNYACRGARGR